MKKENKVRFFISGEYKWEGLDGARFVPDNTWIVDSPKKANANRERINSEVFEIIPVKVKP